MFLLGILKVVTWRIVFDVEQNQRNYISAIHLVNREEQKGYTMITNCQKDFPSSAQSCADKKCAQLSEILNIRRDSSK